MESQLPVNDSPQPEETVGAVLLKTLRELLPIFLAEIVLTGVMLGVYALLRRCTQPVLLGAALGAGVSLLNFFFLIVGVLRASKKENQTAAQLTVRVFYILRTVAVLIALVIALKSARFDPVATLLPLCFMRIALFAAELMRKKKFRKEQA